MSRRTQPCNFYNKRGGCHRGETCSFAHVSAASSSSGNADVSRGPSLARATHPQAPPGVCNFYWSQGACRHEYSCRFKHITSDSNVANKSPERQSNKPEDTIASFLTDAGLAKLTGSGTDGFFTTLKPLSPNETHNHLKKFLYNDYRFRKTFDIYGFVILLNSANISNAGWVRR